MNWIDGLGSMERNRRIGSMELDLWNIGSMEIGAWNGLPTISEERVGARERAHACGLTSHVPKIFFGRQEKTKLVSFHTNVYQLTRASKDHFFFRSKLDRTVDLGPL